MIYHHGTPPPKHTHTRTPTKQTNKPEGRAALYIVSLGVLAPYRDAGLGACVCGRCCCALI